MIVYASRTGNVRYIVGMLDKGIPTKEISQDLIVNEPFALFTYTDGLGDIPKIVQNFLSNPINSKNLKGIIASGNTNFGHDVFCKCADLISQKYNVPIIRKIELRGFHADYEAINEQYKKIIVGDNI